MRRPNDPNHQANQVIQWAWLCQARQNIDHEEICTNNIPRGFVNAVKGGQQTLQTWLTKATKQQAPTLGVETSRKAEQNKWEQEGEF